MNCHYVTEKLTEPWRVRNKEVRYYDFALDKVCDGNTETLFATEDTNTYEIEQLLSKYVEQPLGEFKNKLVGRYQAKRVKHTIKNISDWSVYRALHLYHLVQIARFAKVKIESQPDSPDLDTILLKGELFLNQLVQIYSLNHKVLWVQLPAESAFFFPELGSFQFPVEDPGCITGWTYSYAVPLTPFVALASIGRTANEQTLFDSRQSLSAFSLGLNQNTNQALIPPQMLNSMSDADICAEIRRLREAAVKTAKAVGDIRELVVKMYETAGFNVSVKKPNSSKVN